MCVAHTGRVSGYLSQILFREALLNVALLAAVKQGSAVDVHSSSSLQLSLNNSQVKTNIHLEVLGSYQRISSVYLPFLFNDRCADSLARTQD